MRQSYSSSVIQHYKLIPRDISRRILWAIKNDFPIDKSFITSYVPIDKLISLRQAYNKKKTEIIIDKDSPRNILFYNMIKDVIPDYKWYIDGKHVLFDMPKIAGVEPSLLSLLLWSNDIPIIKSNFYYLYKDMLPSSVFDNIEVLLNQIQVVQPTSQQMQLFIKWISQGLNGKTLNIFSLACPDYSTEPTNNPECPHRHTFNSVGDGIGLVANRILETCPTLLNFFSSNNIKFNQTLAMADYEILSETTCSKLKINRPIFLQKLKNSVAAFKVRVPYIQSLMLTEICGGLDEWSKLYQYYRDRFSKGDFGKSGLDMNKIIEIARSRKDFYERWFGIQESFEKYISILLDQGAEYATVGNIITEYFPNCLIIGADSSLFAEFYSIDKVIPSIYLKRFYI